MPTGWRRDREEIALRGSWRIWPGDVILAVSSVTAGLIIGRRLHRATGLPGAPRIGGRVAGSEGCAAG